ncbi:MAG: DNA polymerase III subunit delta [Proteobacteria bacterium]|nr:DNA polymerase III subunit delta [Pseudomonadota bacterium]
MQIKTDQLAGHLARGMAPLYVLHGDEPLLAQEAGDAIRAAARAAGCGERLVFHVAGAHFDWSGVRGAAQSMGLFAEQRLIELRIPGGKPGKEGSTALSALVTPPPEGVVLLITLPRLDRTGQQSAWFTALDRAGVVVNLLPIERAQLPRWIAQRLAAQGQQVDDEAALALFADRVEGNLLAAHQEIQKLALAHPPGPLTLAAIDAAVGDMARYDVNQWVHATLQAQSARALHLLTALQAAGEQLVPLHYRLSEELRALRLARLALDDGQPLPLALRQARVWGERERLYERLLPGLTAPALTRLVTMASICDGLIKGLPHPDWPRDPWDGLRHLLLATLDALGATRKPHPGRMALRA